jgi:hypothetical protein
VTNRTLFSIAICPFSASGLCHPASRPLSSIIGQAVAAERCQATAQGIEKKRAELLIDDKPPTEIIKLDVEGDTARVTIEKTELFEQEILNRMAALHGAEAEARWRSAYDSMHSCALEYAKSLRASLAELYKFRAAAGELNNFSYAMRRPEAPPVVLGDEILERWLRDLEQDHDFEINRRARQGS